MKPHAFWKDAEGTTALEFALTAPVFILIVFGIIEFGLLFWTQIGLQHGAGLAARCATINPTICSSSSAITTYAAQQSFGLNPPSQTFTYAAVSCGNQVSATFAFQFPQILNLSSVNLTARACFPS